MTQPHSTCAHHLLKHCLSEDQRTEALAHFGTDDVKEAAKDIARMGQRDLQSKFKLVYGTATHSNNNDWLRRKLYEAVGAAPMKTTTKSKQRKPSTPKGRSRTNDTKCDPAFGNGRRFRRNSKGKSKLDSNDITKKSQRALPSSPVGGRSVLDFNGLMIHDVSTSSDSDGWEADENVAHQIQMYSDSQPITSSEEPTARSSFWESSQSCSNIAAMEGILNGQIASYSQRLPSLGCPLPPLNFDQSSTMNSGLRIDAWADAALKAQSSRRQPNLPMGICLGEEDESMLISMDLSAFDTSAGCSFL